MAKISSLKHVPIKYSHSFFHNRSLKSSVYLMLTTHLILEQPHFKFSIAISGSHIGHCKSRVFYDLLWWFKDLRNDTNQRRKEWDFKYNTLTHVSEKTLIEIVLAIQKLKPACWVF